MSRGAGFYPEFEMSITVKKLPDDHVRPVGQILDKALADVGEYARTTRGEAHAIEAQVDIAQPELSIKQMHDQTMAKALKEANGNKRAASKLLEISERTVDRWISRKGEEAIT